MIKLKELLNETSVSMGQVKSNPYASSFKSQDLLKEDSHKEGKMAKHDAMECASDSKDVSDMIKDDMDLPEWLEAKITKSADYMNSVKDYLTHHMSGEVTEDLDTPAKYSNPESKLHIDADITKMSKHLGKASQQVIKIMMDGVKGGRYDALDIQRGIEFGPLNRTHEGERPFMKMLWRKVRQGFRRYMPKGKLRK